MSYKTSINPVLQRWLDQPRGVDLDEHLSTVQKSLKIFRNNTYLLNSMALKIQHWFFVKRHHYNARKLQSCSLEEVAQPFRLPKLQSQRSSVMSFQTPSAPIKKSQCITLGRASFNKKPAGLANIRQKNNKRNRGTPSSFASPSAERVNCFSNEFSSFDGNS